MIMLTLRCILSHVRCVVLASQRRLVGQATVPLLTLLQPNKRTRHTRLSRGAFTLPGASTCT